MLFVSQPLLSIFFLPFFFLLLFLTFFSFPALLDYRVEKSDKASSFTVLLWVWDRETAQSHAKSCLTTRLSPILECLVRLHGLLGIQQNLPTVQLQSLFLCACHDPQRQDSYKATSSHLEQFIPCTVGRMGSHPSSAAQQQRREGRYSIQRATDPRVLLKWKFNLIFTF